MATRAERTDPPAVQLADAIERTLPRWLNLASWLLAAHPRSARSVLLVLHDHVPFLVRRDHAKITAKV